LNHGPNWAEASAAELRAKVDAALDDRRGWVVDGNYERKLGNILLERAELIVWLDQTAPRRGSHLATMDRSGRALEWQSGIAEWSSLGQRGFVPLDRPEPFSSVAVSGRNCCKGVTWFA